MKASLGATALPHAGVRVLHGEEDLLRLSIADLVLVVALEVGEHLGETGLLAYLQRVEKRQVLEAHRHARNRLRTLHPGHFLFFFIFFIYFLF